ncbi:MAG: bifunctional precorrin-2 dehydrogenase/sirohydrochlorin ferrochelatase [Fusobacterium sp.]|nr:bifunctional precorrin-2 dehydrogenase/sirohydrochlorin ferrochelatase [Fusobacterium sp.]
MENKDFFPLFINLNKKKVLVIGAGKIAYRKVTTLLEQGADIEVITLEIAEQKFNLLKNIKLTIQPFEESMLNNKFLVITATNNSEFNKKIAELCDEKGILVNNISSKIHMNCRFCSVLETENYTVGISAKGDPKKSKALKEKLQNLLLNQ